MVQKKLTKKIRNEAEKLETLILQAKPSKEGIDKKARTAYTS